MSRTRLSKSGIEYLDYSWGFYSGCWNWKNGICGGGGQEFNCWAKSIVKRFPAYYPDGFEPTYYPEAFLSPLYLKEPSVIGVAWMGDLFGDWVDPDQLVHVTAGVIDNKEIGWDARLKFQLFHTIQSCPQHTFVFLTKCPWNLPKWSPFPQNCRVGATAVDPTSFAAAYYHLALVEARVKFISLEPLLDWDRRATVALIRQAYQAGVTWLPVGAATQPYRPPKIELVEEIVRAADSAGIGVFLKENLKGITMKAAEVVKYHNLAATTVCVDQERGLWRLNDLRQELPL